MKTLIIVLIVLVVLVIPAFFGLRRIFFQNLPVVTQPNIPSSTSSADKKTDNPKISIVAEGLDVPWALVFLPDGEILFTERKGLVKMVKNGQVIDVVALDEVKQMGEGGLMGIAIHPKFNENRFAYLYYTYGESGNNVLNRVVRYKLNEESKLIDRTIIVDNIPGASNHDGGRIKFGPDGNLYIATGDAQEPSLAQDKNSLAGKILRVTDEGKVPVDNPFNSPVFSFGHRNPQGLTWDEKGTFWETEHGPSGGTLGVGNDEVNKIEVGKNYGWPVIQGNQTKDGMVTPIVNSGTGVWAPSGTAFLNGSIFFAGLRGASLFEVELNNPTKVIEHFKGELGRIREVVVGPDGMLYITTSNKDGRGVPRAGDDKILRVNPAKL